MHSALKLGQLPAGGGQLPQGAAADHAHQGGHGLDAAQILPLPFRDGVQPDDPGRLALGFQHGPNSPGLVDGLGVREDDQGRPRAQYRRLLGADLLQSRAQIRAPAIDAGVPNEGAEGIHIVKLKGIRLYKAL